MPKYTRKNSLTAEKHIISQPAPHAVTPISRTNRVQINGGVPVVKPIINVQGGGGGLDCAGIMNCAGIIDILTRLDTLEGAGYITCSDLNTTCLETIQDIVGGMIGSTTGITVTYDDITGVINYTVLATPATITIQDEGVDQCVDATIINFQGAGVTATCLGGVATVTIPGGGSGGYDTIQEEGTPLTQRTVMNFIGTSVTAVDDGGNSRTNITVQAYNTVQDEGTPLTQRDTINFIGNLVDAVDNGGTSTTDVTIQSLPHQFNEDDDTVQILTLTGANEALTNIVPIVPITIGQTGEYLITACMSCTVNVPQNAQYIYMNILVNGNRILTDNYGINENIGSENTISGVRTYSLTAGDVVSIEWRVASNDGGGSTFQIISGVNQPGVTLNTLCVG